MHTKENYLIISFIIVAWLYYAVITAYLVATAVFDITFFTYETFLANYIFYGLLYASFFWFGAMELMILWVIPIIYGMTVFVFFAIIFIVGMNQEVFTRGVLGGTTRTWADQYIGNWVLHVIPTIFILLTIIALHRVTGPILSSFWLFSNNLQRAGYIIYVLFIPSAILLIYMGTMPWEQNYLLSWSFTTVALMQIGLSVVVQLLLVAIAGIITSCHLGSERHLHTPFGYYQ